MTGTVAPFRAWRGSRAVVGEGTSRSSDRQKNEDSGESGIRTRGTISGTHDFQSCTFDRSVISPSQTFFKEAIAESEGFEPPVPLRAHLISNQAPSATRSALRARHPIREFARVNAVCAAANAYSGLRRCARMRSKKALSCCEHSLPSTPLTTSKRWFRRGSWPIVYSELTAPALGSAQP